MGCVECWGLCRGVQSAARTSLILCRKFADDRVESLDVQADDLGRIEKIGIATNLPTGSLF